MTQAELLEQMPDALKAHLAPTLGLWWIYRTVMWLKRQHAHLSEFRLWVRPIILLFLLVAYVLDALYNATVAWRIFRDPPREWTLTARLQRYKREGTGWPKEAGIRDVIPQANQWKPRYLTSMKMRYQLAVWICDNMLNPYDPDGEHC